MTEIPRVEELTYAEASSELDEIVQFFEGRDVDVDQLVGRLVRATALVEELDRRLRRTRMQVDQLVPRLAAVLSDDPEAADDRGAGDDDPAPGDDRDPAAGDDDAAAGDDPADAAGSDGPLDGGPAPGLF